MGDQTTAKLSSLAAIIQEFNVDGQNIVQGFTKREYYEKYNGPWFGATIGRVANRIKGGVINNLNGREVKLETNNGPNALHGGSRGFGRLQFEGPTLLKRDGKDALLYTYFSPDGDQGYPGAVELRVYYVVSEVVEEGVTRSMACGSMRPNKRGSHSWTQSMTSCAREGKTSQDCKASFGQSRL